MISQHEDCERGWSAISGHGYPDPAIHELYERSLALVRPDGHVAWSGHTVADEASTIIDRMRGSP